MRLQPSASYSFTMRLRLPQQGNAFAAVAQAIAESAGMLGAIDLVRVERDGVVRDVTVACGDSGHAESVVAAVRAVEGVTVDSVSDRTFLLHRRQDRGQAEGGDPRRATTSRWPTRPASRA